MIKNISKKYRKQEIESDKKINNTRFNRTNLVKVEIEHEPISEAKVEIKPESVSDVKETKKTKSSETKKNENTKQDE